MGGACPPPGLSSALVAPAAAHFRPPKKACLATPGDEVFSGNPCMETRQGLGRTLSRTWQPGPPCLRRLATAGGLRTLWAGEPSCSPVDARLQEVNRARLPDPSVAPGLRPILPSRAVLSCGQLPAGVTSCSVPSPTSRMLNPSVADQVTQLTLKLLEKVTRPAPAFMFSAPG